MIHHKDTGLFIQNYPAIIGTDVSGEIVDVGSSITQFGKGDHVMAVCCGMRTKQSKHLAFQLYCVAPENTITKIPPSMSFVQACVFPLGLATATSALFQIDRLALPFPEPGRKVTRKDKVLLVRGASSSVGVNAVQMALAAGFSVAATASPHNHSMLEELGAEYVFDYRKEGVENDIVAALKDKVFAGAFDAVQFGTRACVNIACQLTGTRSTSVATVSPFPPQDGVPENIALTGGKAGFLDEKSAFGEQCIFFPS